MTSKPETPAPAATRPAADSAADPTLTPPGGWVMRLILRVLLPLAILVGGALVAAHLIATGPEAKQRPPERRARLVEVEQVTFGPQRAIVHAMGTVGPAVSVDLHPRVGGEVVEVSKEFVPGGRFGEGGLILQIDKEDYTLAVERQRLAAEQAELAADQSDLALEQRQSAVARTEGELKLELGQQDIARREYELLGEDVGDAAEELVLRQPQFRTAQAAEQAAKTAIKEADVACKAARAAAKEAQNTLRRAELDLERTAIQAPFNALVQSRGVNLGATVSAATVLATLIGTDAYWVEVSVPVDQLPWIQVPRTTDEPGAAVRVFDEAAWGADRFRTGRVCRLAGDLEEQGRMARLLVAVEDPLALAEANRGQPALLINSYVRVEIEGTPIASAASVSRTLLRDGDHVWVMGPDDLLQIRPVTVVFRSRDAVLVTGGLKAGDRLVVTDLAAPVEGMPLRLRTDESPAVESATEGPAAEKPPAAPPAAEKTTSPAAGKAAPSAEKPASPTAEKAAPPAAQGPAQ
ncbi:MAG: HlyD family efflux transporter periplasmic adaptor subunit [Planctomycetes bacterium]|nr:HlyD family efflux transporter periplasmic adaptor subunit [Planctomycetota bacterium]